MPGKKTAAKKKYRKRKVRSFTLTDEVYERLRSIRRAGESTSAALERYVKDTVRRTKKKLKKVTSLV